MHTQEKKKEKEEKKEGKLKLQHYKKKKNKVVFLWLNSILWNLYLVVNLY